MTLIALNYWIPVAYKRALKKKEKFLLNFSFNYSLPFLSIVFIEDLLNLISTKFFKFFKWLANVWILYCIKNLKKGRNKNINIIYKEFIISNFLREVLITFTVRILNKNWPLRKRMEIYHLKIKRWNMHLCKFIQSYSLNTA